MPRGRLGGGAPLILILALILPQAQVNRNRDRVWKVVSREASYLRYGAGDQGLRSTELFDYSVSCRLHPHKRYSRTDQLNWIGFTPMLV